MTLEPTPQDARPAVSCTDHETVIKLVLSTPAVHGHEAAASQPAAEAELRGRVAALERALADANARIDALARAVSSAIASAPVIEPLPESVELLLRHAAEREAEHGHADTWTAAPAALISAAPPVVAPATGAGAPPPEGSTPPPHAEPASPRARGLRRMATALRQL